MRSVRNNTSNGNRMGDPGGNNYTNEGTRVNNYAANSSSEDENELTQLKPNQHSQKIKPNNKNSKKVGSNKKNYTNGIFQDPQTDLNSHHFIMNNGQYEDTLSPNESENTYAEASLLPTSMANQINRQSNRYEQGILQYDSEVYANGSNETCGNDGYGKDGNSSSGSGRYQIPHQISSHGMNTNRSPQHSDRNGIHDSSQNYSTANDAISLNKSPFLSSSTNSSRTNGRSSSSMASSTNKRGGGRDGGGFGRKDLNQPPMLPSDPPGTRRQLPSGLGGQTVDKNWDYISGATTLGGDYLKYNQQIPNSATLIASDRRAQHTMGNRGNIAHRRSLSDESFGMEGNCHGKGLGSPSNMRGTVQHTHLTGAVSTSMGGGVDPILGVEQTVVMPGFPVRTLQHHPPPPYSPSREKFVMGRKCRFHCSWKLVALGLTALTLILSSVIAYFGAVTYHPSDPAANAIGTGKNTISQAADFVQESQLRLPSSDSAISHSAGSNPDCIPVSDVVRLTQHSDGNRQPQAVLPANIDYIPSGDSSSSSYRNNLRISTQSPTFQKPIILPPTNLNLGQWYSANIAPLSFWRARLTVQQSSQNYEMNLTFVGNSSPMGINEKSNVAIYGRRSEAPTITNYDWVHMITEDGDVKIVKKRSIGTETSDFISEDDPHEYKQRVDRSSNRGNNEVVTLTKALSRGDWYIGVFNDDTNARTIRTVVGKKRRGSSCPNDCNGHGSCDSGKCRCSPQYSGSDCSKSVCPLLCSGHGVYAGGQCHCVDGWKGRECEIVETECIDPSCNGHGRCREGVCICSSGWTGESCEIRDCYDKKCSGHGICQNAQCICDIGWIGRNCERRNSVLMQCLPDCSSHGDFDVENGKCNCHDHWTGRECNISL